MERSRSLATSTRLQILGHLDRLHTALPAVVTAYDADTQRASIKPLVKHGFYDEADVRRLESLGIQQNVPVFFPGGGGMRLTFPISDGSLIDLDTLDLIPATTGYFIVAEESLDAWLSGTGQEVDPVFDVRFDLSSGVFFPQVNPFGSPWSNVPTDHATLGADAGVLLHAYRDHLAVATAAGETLAKAEQTTVRGTEFMADLGLMLGNLAILLPALTPLLTPPQLVALAALIAPPFAPGSILTVVAKTAAPPATLPGTYLSPNLLLP